ncbi:K-box region and MADS-box transcription factor family protein [Prunus dulcis]|uniref:K-box region and MADS-box transcription factor family protein n=1 Tax=Prunus dulcis TaxID=3755 RepID=A0A4Y1RZH7_PRUDU|nr:K-box region and MADS-box transcription factor family protein [Prunus dulcis]
MNQEDRQHNGEAGDVFEEEERAFSRKPRSSLLSAMLRLLFVQQVIERHGLLSSNYDQLNQPSLELQMTK